MSAQSMVVKKDESRLTSILSDMLPVLRTKIIQSFTPSRVLSIPSEGGFYTSFRI